MCLESPFTLLEHILGFTFPGHCSLVRGIRSQFMKSSLPHFRRVFLSYNFKYLSRLIVSVFFFRNSHYTFVGSPLHVFSVFLLEFFDFLDHFCLILFTFLIFNLRYLLLYFVWSLFSLIFLLVWSSLLKRFCLFLFFPSPFLRSVGPRASCSWLAITSSNPFLL